MIFINDHKKIVLPFITVLVIWLSFDSLIDLLLSVIHFLFGLLHYLFEFIEQALDLIVEHIFHTDPHITEIIVFYILFLNGIFICFKLNKTLHLQFKKWFNQLSYFCDEKKGMVLMCSQNLFLLKNIRRCSIIMMCLSLVAALIFS